MSPTIAFLRLCFVVLFGAMSLMHGPVMTFSGAHATAAAEQQRAAHSADAASDCHEDQAPPTKHSTCNAFACFMAVEPLSAMTRPLSPILFAILAAAPMTALDPVPTAPALPPPRLQG
jgi:hypothetical protein